MPDNLAVRDSRPADLAAIERLYPAAFPDEDLLPLVRALLQIPSSTVSLVGECSEDITAHLIFTLCGITGSSSGVALLGPLAVAPAWQKRGLGSAIVDRGLTRLADAGIDLVCVLGDPAYYARFGFAPEPHVQAPFRLPEAWQDAWQSLKISSKRPEPGTLLVPGPWRQPALWAP